MLEQVSQGDSKTIITYL